MPLIYARSYSKWLRRGTCPASWWWRNRGSPAARLLAGFYRVLARAGRERGVTPCTLLFYSSANGNPINHTGMALEWMPVLFVHRMALLTSSFLYQRHRLGSAFINFAFLLQGLDEGMRCKTKWLYYRNKSSKQKRWSLLLWPFKLKIIANVI